MRIKRSGLSTMAILLIITTLISFSCQLPEPNSKDLGKQLIDVHGAGAQRSDPKSGDPELFPEGHGPQGDVVCIYNYVRCVRGNSVNDGNTSFVVVDTGQNKSYDNGTIGELSSFPNIGELYYGQDAQYSGTTADYTDNGETITDNITGLIWEKGFNKVEWKNATNFASTSTTGGYSDWRVPTIKELYSLINFSGSTGTGNPFEANAPSDAVPYIDTDFFDFEYSPSGRYIDAQYISITEYVSTTMNDSPTFFGVNLADGRIKGYPQSGNMNDNTYYIRLVRGNIEYGKNRFQDNGNNTITDLATGLTWMKIDSGDSSLKNNLDGYINTDGSLNWEEALDFSENLTFANNSDWRLPNAKELQSIVDYSRSPDTTSSGAIDSVFEITSTIDGNGNIDYPYFWTNTTHLDGINVGEYAVYLSFGEAKGYFLPPLRE